MQRRSQRPRRRSHKRQQRNWKRVNIVNERLEVRDMLTNLSLTFSDYEVSESWGAGIVTGSISRFGGDVSQPLEITLTSSDETRLVVPATVTVPANETVESFPIDIIDNSQLDGDIYVTINATAGTSSTDNSILVHDYETATLTLDQTSASPGDIITGSIVVSVVGHTAPLDVPINSSRPEEIAPTSVTIPVGQQSANFSLPVTSDAVAEGAHAVRLEVDPDSAWEWELETVVVSDPGRHHGLAGGRR